MKTRFLSIENCCFCGACIDACPQKALSIRENRNGFYYPYYDSSKCIDCHLCERVCNCFHPETIKRNDERKAVPYAAWTTNEDLIKRSASGGVFAQLAYDFLESESGYVYGASLLEDSTVCHIEIANRKDICKLQNSKYQQSNTVGIYKQVKQRLKQGAKVLFSGVPCQVSALYEFLAVANTSIDNLYTIEVLCHGVPTNLLGRKALKYHNAKRIIGYRTKVQGGGSVGNRLTYEMQDGTMMKCRTHDDDFLFKSYLTFTSSRKSCYCCHYGNINRAADITLGDFWGMEHSTQAQLYENFMGTSVAITNNSRGRALLVKSKEMHLQEIMWEEFLPYNQNMYMPTNTQKYIISDYLFLIKLLPARLQNVIYRDCVYHRTLSSLYDDVWNKCFHWNEKQIAKEEEKLRRCAQALEYLNSTKTEK